MASMIVPRLLFINSFSFWLMFYIGQCTFGRSRGTVGPCPDNCAGAECDSLTGYCTAGCVPGYLGDTCTSACAPGTWGPACENTCGIKCLGGVCHHENGTCTNGCMIGYQGSKCDSVCTIGTWGNQCGDVCQVGCYGGNCDHIDGHCTNGCILGYNGLYCDTKNIISLVTPSLDVHAETRVKLLVMVQNFTTQPLTKVHIKFGNQEPCFIETGWHVLGVSSGIHTFYGIEVNVTGFTHFHLVDHMFFEETATLVNVTMDNQGVVNYDSITYNSSRHHIPKECYLGVTMNNASSNISSPFQVERSSIPIFSLNWTSDSTCFANYNIVEHLTYYGYAWAIRYHRDDICWEAGNTKVPIHFITWHANFIVPPRYLPIGFYIVNARMNNKLTKSSGEQILFSNNIDSYIEITQDKVKASLGSQLPTTNLYSEALVLNASTSEDPEGTLTLSDFQFSWTCMMDDVLPCIISGIALGSGNNTLPFTDPVVTFSSRSLKANSTYLFEVTVSALGRLDGKAQQSIFIQNDIQPEMVIICISNCGDKLNPEVNWVVALNQTQDLEHSWSGMVIRWEMDDGTKILVNEDNLPQLTVDASLLQVNTSYSFHADFSLQVTSELQLVGSTQFFNKTSNDMPVAGSCDCSPTHGFANLTKFSISCTGFYDNDLPVIYRIRINSTVLVEGETASFSDVVIPVGGVSQDGYYHNISVEVSDKFDGTATYNFLLLVYPSVEEYAESINQPPVSSSGCVVDPPSGYALTTNFTVVCSQFTDQDSPLTYYLYYKRYPDTESLLYQGNVTTTPVFYLGEGLSENHTVPLVFRAEDTYRAATDIDLSVQVLPHSNFVDVLDLVQDNFLSGETETTSELTIEIIGVLGTVVNDDTVNDTDNAARLQQRVEIRETLTQSLLNTEVEPNIHVVNQVVQVIDSLTKFKEEVTEKQEEMTVAVFGNLTKKFDDVEKTDVVETRSTSSNLLTSMGSIMTVIIDRGTTIQKLNTSDLITEESKKEKLEKVKRNSLQMLASVEKVVDILTETIDSAEDEAVIIQTPVMSVRVQEIDTNNMTETNFTLSVQSDNSSIGLQLPPTQSLRQSEGDNSSVYTQIMVTKDNIYNWDKSAAHFTSSVVDIVVKDKQLQTKTLTNLADPVRLQFDVEDQVLESDTLTFTYETTTGNITSSTLLKVSMTHLDSAMALQVYIKVIESNLTLMYYTTTTDETVSSRTVQGYGRPVPQNNSEGSADMLILDGSPQYLILAVKEGQSVSVSETDVPFVRADVSVEIGIYNTACGYYNKTRDQWASDGCVVAPPESLTTLTCSCNHLTSFAAGFIVVPHLVDPIADASLFLTFFDNPVIVITVVIIWCFYLIMLVWARRKDRIESMKGGVNVLEDNNTEDKYVYVVGFVTGWWKSAGTTSNVFMCLHGSKGFSSKHLMSGGVVQHFQTGAEDWFVLTTPVSLGKLQSVVIWHDNSGEDPAWFLKQIVVRDIQMDKTWHFLYNDWLAVDQGVGRIKVEIDALTPEDLVQNSLYQFGIQSSKDLQNNHLWISIISCPAYSPFTRVQRLSCALSLLLTTMLTSLMFHGIPTDNPADQLSTGGITVSLSDIIIGIQSGLIMFPINFIIMQLFTKIKPRPSDLAEEKSSQASGPKEKDKLFDVHASENEKKSKLEKETPKGSQQKKPFQFPWWVVYIAWILVLSTALVSSYFVMLYGLMYGYQKSIEWLVSFFTAFFQSAFVTQPLKVFLIASLLAFIFKKPVEFEVLNQKDMKLKHDEDYCQTKLLEKQGVMQSSIAPVKQAVHAAMPRQALQALRDRLRLEEHITTILREMIMYFTFVAVVLFMVHGHQDVTTNYGATRNTEDMFVHGKYTEVALTKVEKVEDMWKYLQDTVVRVLYTDTGMMANGVGYLAGTVRLRQKRIEKGVTCYRINVQKFASLFPDQDCKVPFSTSDEEWQSFNTSWDWPLPKEAAVKTKYKAWKYRSSWELKTLPFVGRLASYSGGGFVTELPADNADAHIALNDLRSEKWVDEYTRAVFLEFTSYNPNVDLFTVVVIIFEMSNLGNIMPYYQFFSSKLNHYDSDLGRFVAVCESLFLVYLLGFTYFEVKKFRRLRKREYFSNTWSYMEIMIIVLGYCTIGLFFQRLVLVDSVLSEYRENGSDKFTSFYTAVFWDFVLTYVMAALVMLVILKVFKLFRFNTSTTVLMQTLKIARGNLMNFAFLFFISFIAFVLFAHLVFGYWIVDYKDVGSSIITLSNFLLGVSDYAKLEQAHFVLGPAFFFMFAFLIQYILLSVFVAIILEAQSQSRKVGQRDVPLTKFVCERFLLMIGFLKRSDYK